MTVGELINLLSQAQPQVAVRLNISLRGDGRKKHSPWVDDFRVGWDKDTIVIRGEQKEVD